MGDGARRPVVIVGAGGQGREAHAILAAAGIAVLGFVDDGDVDQERLARLGCPLLGDATVVADLDADVVVGIGASVVRAEVAARFPAERIAAAAVHPAASIGTDVELGRGVLLAPGARLTTDVRLGDHVHIGTNAVVGHDCRLADAVSVYSGATLSGGVEAGHACTIGAGATLLPSVRVGPRAVVGAGAVVTADVEPDAVVAGVPARRLRVGGGSDVPDSPGRIGQ